jgi:hypothetical protein
MPRLSTGLLTTTINLLGRVVRLDASAFKELRETSAVTPFALAAVPLGLFAFALGTYFWFAFEVENSWELFWKSVLVGTVIGCLLWGVWAAVTYVMLTAVFREELHLDELLRVAGGASIVLALGFFAFIPGITFGVSLLATVAWAMVTAFALQSAFDLTPQRSTVSAISGFAVFSLIMPLIATADHPLGPGIFVFDSFKDAFIELTDLLRAFSQT